MRGSFSRGCAASAALATALLGASAAQSQELAPTLLSYRAPDDCPATEAFQRSVQRRSTRIRFVDEGSHARELSIEITTEGSVTIGELRLTEADGSLRQRSVRFSSCSEAVEGLALITLVSLDPQALLEAPPVAPPEAPPPPPKPSSAAPPPEKHAPRPPPPASPVEVALGVQVGGSYRALPELAPTGVLLFDIASRSRSWLSPLLRVSVAHSQVRGVEQGRAEAGFALTQATLSLCPLRASSRSFALRPCLFASGGALHAWGEGTTNPQARTRPYWAWGGSALAFVRAAEAVDIIADLGLGAPLVRDQYAFEQVPVWKTPALYLSAGIGARFVFR